MGLCVSINLQNKKVLVIGGGLVALRKAKLLLSQGALLSVIAPEFDHAFASLPCHCIVKEYEEKDLKGYWMVIAACNSSNINASIIQAAKASNILCMSVHRDKEADMHALLSKETENFQIAVSTKQTYPAMNTVVLTAVETFVEQTFQTRMRLLKPLRELVLHNDQLIDRHEILRTLANADLRQLMFLHDAINKKTCLLLCFHGVQQEQGINEIYDFIQQLQPCMQEEAIGFAFLSKHIAPKETTVDRWWALRNLLPFLEAFSITINLYPMLFQKGIYYQQILAYQTSLVHAMKPPFATIGDVRALLDVCQASIGAQNKMICMYHASQTGALSTMLNELKPIYPNMLFVNTEQQITDIPYSNEKVMVFPLYMLTGFHMIQDQDAQSPIINKLKQQHCEIDQNHRSCIAHPKLQELLIKKIQEAIESSKKQS